MTIMRGLYKHYKSGPESRYQKNTKRYCKIGSLKVAKEYQLGQQNIQCSSGQFQQM